MTKAKEKTRFVIIQPPSLKFLLPSGEGILRKGAIK